MALNYAFELIPGFYYQIYNSAEPYSLGAMYPTLMNTLLIPSFYIASKLIYKNSFSSQVSSTGG